SPGQVDLDGFPPQVQAQRAVVTDVADGATVDQVVDRPELPRGVHEAPDLVGVGDVAGAVHHPPAEGADRGRGLFGVAGAAGIAKGDVGPFAGQAEGGRPANAARPARNEGHALVEFVRHDRFLASIRRGPRLSNSSTQRSWCPTDRSLHLTKAAPPMACPSLDDFRVRRSMWPESATARAKLHAVFWTDARKTQSKRVPSSSRGEGGSSPLR